MAHPASIGIFDSGLGGLSVLRLLPSLLPGVPMVYVADSGHAPYGPQTRIEVIAYSERIAAYLIDTLGCQALVIACNTATAAAAETLRARYPNLPIIGMEPAVKPAASATVTGKVGVMATAGTIGSERYAELLSAHGRGITVIEDPCVGLVPLIERGELDTLALRKLLKTILRPMVAAGVDTIVLGCTHFPLVRDEIAAVVGPDVSLIDPAPAVVRQVVRRLGTQDVDVAARSPITFLTTGSIDAFRQNLQALVPELLEGAVIGFAPS